MKNDKREFEKNSLLLFVLMMCGNVCNYLFQIVMGNLMEVEEYAQVNTVVSLVGVLSIPTTIVTMICARYIAIYSAENLEQNEDKIAGVIQILLKFVAIIGITLIALTFLLRGAITTLFTLESKWYVIGVLVIALVNLCFSVTAGTLQGMKMFLPYGIQTILTSGGKLILGIIFVLIGWKVYGVITGIFLGILISTLYGVHYMGKYVRRAIALKTIGGLDIREFIRYSASTVIAQGCVIAMTNGDILLVKAYFSATEAGIYSSASVLGKIAMYISTAIVAALFPMVVEKYLKGEDTKALFHKALLYGGGMAVVCAAVMTIGGKYVVGILFGERYVNAIEVLPSVCVYVVALTFITILMNYLLAINQIRNFDMTMIAALIIIIGGSMVWHDSVSQVMLFSGCVLFVVFVWNILFLCRREKAKNQ